MNTCKLILHIRIKAAAILWAVSVGQRGVGGAKSKSLCLRRQTY
jgi:hypothetical protein